MAKKLASLDALRGVAILLVIAAHFGGWTPFTQVMLGNAGVILFFFLSGFLMDLTLTHDGNLRSYVIRRSFRILPMYWASLIIAVAWGAAWSWPKLLSNATFTAPVFGESRMLGVYWTLYIEVLFYCIAPFLKRGGDKVIAVSIYAAIAFFAAASFMHGIGKGAPVYILFCLCGMQIGAWYRGSAGAIPVVCSVLAATIATATLLPVSIFIFAIPPICAAALAVCLTCDLPERPIAFVGKVSYSWYLLHSIFEPSFSLPVGAAVTFAMSVVTYFVIERRGILVGKRLIKSIDARSADFVPAAAD